MLLPHINLKVIKMEKESQEILLSTPKVGNVEISTLKIGDSVKININNKEKVWVEITEINNSTLKGNEFKGKLDVNPYFLNDIKFGDTIKFQSENILDILTN